MTLTLNDIENAHLRIKNFLEPTPLLRCQLLENELHFDGKLFFKCEQDHPTGSFKVRGAFNVLSLLTHDERKLGVITRSSGNFAQAVAYAAQRLNVAATIVMPRNAPTIKFEGTKKFGATIIISGNQHIDGERIVDQLVTEKNYVSLHPYNNYRTMAGQGTAALEILNQNPNIDHFFCPIGGGGLLSGCATAFKGIAPGVKIHGVEPAGAADYFASRQSGKKETNESIATIADGLRAPTVGELNYPILNKNVDEVSTVTDEEIKIAMKWLYEKMQITTEPSGAVSLAGFMKQSKLIKGNVVILLSGKNVDPENFNEWIK